MLMKRLFLCFLLLVSVVVCHSSTLTSLSSFDGFHPENTLGSFIRSQERFRVDLSYDNRYFLSGLSESKLFIAKSQFPHAYSLLASVKGNRHIKQYSFSSGYALKLNRKLAIGPTAKFDLQSTNRYGMEIQQWSVGLSSHLKYSQVISGYLEVGLTRDKLFQANWKQQLDLHMGITKELSEACDLLLMLKSTARHPLNGLGAIIYRPLENNQISLAIQLHDHPFMLAYSLKLNSMLLSFGLYYHLYLGMSSPLMVSFESN